jgi:arylsulfatase
MSDTPKDVLIAAYLCEDLAQRDFEAVLKLAEDNAITVEGVVLVQKDSDGEIHVTETGDHLGRKGLAVGGGAGLVVGLLAPRCWQRRSSARPPAGSWPSSPSTASREGSRRT